MKIKINEQNKDKITAALTAANGGCKSHTYTDWTEIRSVAVAAEAKLDGVNLAAKSRAGATALACSGRSVPNAYKYARTVTRVEMIRGSKDWFLTGLTAISTHDRRGERTRIFLSAAQAQIAVAKFSEQFTIINNISIA
jgi:hypothetical protein